MLLQILASNSSSSTDFQMTKTKIFFKCCNLSFNMRKKLWTLILQVTDIAICPFHWVDDETMQKQTHHHQLMKIIIYLMRAVLRKENRKRNQRSTWLLEQYSQCFITKNQEPSFSPPEKKKGEVNMEKTLIQKVTTWVFIILYKFFCRFEMY